MLYRSNKNPTKKFLNFEFIASQVRIIDGFKNSFTVRGHIVLVGKKNLKKYLKILEQK